MKVEIDTSKVRNVASTIRTKQEEIVKELNSTIIPALNSLNGKYVNLNKEDMIDQVNKEFENLDKRLNSLIEILNNNVAGGFEELGESIKHAFNEEFKTQFEELINTDE